MNIIKKYGRKDEIDAFYVTIFNLYLCYLCVLDQSYSTHLDNYNIKKHNILQWNDHLKTSLIVYKFDYG